MGQSPYESLAVRGRGKLQVVRMTRIIQTGRQLQIIYIYMELHIYYIWRHQKKKEKKSISKNFDLHYNPRAAFSNSATASSRAAATASSPCCAKCFSKT